MKKVVAIFIVLSILITTLSLTSVFADEQKGFEDQTKKVLVVHQKEKKKSFFSKVFNKWGNLILKSNWTMWYYILTTVGLIKLFEKLEVFDSNDVYRSVLSKDYGSFFGSLLLNIKNLPDNVKLIYQSLKKDKTPAEKENYEVLCNKLCPNLDKNSAKAAICQIVDFINPKENNETNNENNSTNKISDLLRSVSKTEQPIVDAMDYLKVHAILMWVSSIVGVAIGMLGSAVGAFNFGWLYGSIMIPYLWSFKDKNKGDLEILANGVDFADNLCNNISQKFNETKNEVVNLFNVTLPQYIVNLTNCFNDLE